MRTDKRASTVLQLFKDAVTEYALPSRIRMDRGTENLYVALYMLSHPSRGVGRGSVITGASTHNQRIERLWGDVFRCICTFYNLFITFEEDGMLNVNSSDILALQYVYVPIIQSHLNTFMAAWSQHKMRTENNATPQQLFDSVSPRDVDDVI